MASLGISGAVVALLSLSMTSAVRIRTSCVELADELFQQRQLEHLVDRAALAAGAGPGFPAPVSSLTSDTVVFASDHDGNRAVDGSSSETTALEVRQSSGDARVRVRFGKQTMTVVEVADSVARLDVVDRRGAAASASTAALLDLRIAPADGDSRERRLLFSVPAPAGP
jgi:hypothetical protein